MSRPIVAIACIFELLRIVGPLTAPTSMALTCRWRSRPQHQKRTLLTTSVRPSRANCGSGRAELVLLGSQLGTSDQTSMSLVIWTAVTSDGTLDSVSVAYRVTLTAGLFGASAIPETPGRAAHPLDHRPVVPPSPFSKRGAKQIGWSLSAHPASVSRLRHLKTDRQFQQSAAG